MYILGVRWGFIKVERCTYWGIMGVCVLKSQRTHWLYVHVDKLSDYIVCICTDQFSKCCSFYLDHRSHQTRIPLPRHLTRELLIPFGLVKPLPSGELCLLKPILRGSARKFSSQHALGRQFLRICSAYNCRYGKI